MNLIKRIVRRLLGLTDIDDIIIDFITKKKKLDKLAVKRESEARQMEVKAAKAEIAATRARKIATKLSEISE